MKTQIKLLRKNGFALVVSLALMMLLALLALGLLSLATITTRSGTGSDMSVARANARLALILAIGQLQKNAGPDQRVTAEASLLEEPATGSPTLAQRHWTGVWRTDRLKAETTNPAGQAPMIYRKDVGVANPGATNVDWNSLIDRRADGSYNKADEVLDWMVSNPNPGTMPDHTFSPPASDTAWVKLVGDASAPASGHVSVPKIDTEGKTGTVSGSLAWWTSDESVKARLDMAPPTETPADDFAGLVSSRFGIGSMTGLNAYDGAAAKPDQLPSKNSLKFQVADDDLRKARFHDIGYGTYGVFADSLHGGLKRDLSAILSSGTAPAGADSKRRPAIDGDTPIFNPLSLSIISPKWGMLKEWNDLASSVSGSPGSVAPKPGVTGSSYVISQTGSGRTRGGGRQERALGVAINDQSKVAVHPMLLDCSFQFGLSYHNAAAGAPKAYAPRLHYSPRVVLWNPYNVNITAASYAVHMSALSDVNYTIRDSSNTVLLNEGGALNGAPTIRAYYNNPDNGSPYCPVFYLPNISFKPGEAVLFTLPSGFSQPWPALNAAARNLASFELVPNATAPFNGSWYFDFPANARYTFNATPAQISGGLRGGVGGTASSGGYYVACYSMLGLVQSGSGNAGTIFNTNAIIPLQTINSTEDGAYASDRPAVYYEKSEDFGGVVSSLVPVELSSNVGAFRPYYRSKWGHRATWINELASNSTTGSAGFNWGGSPRFYNASFTNYNQLMNRNLRAAWQFRSPVANVTRANAPSGGAGRVGINNLIDDPYYWEVDDSTLHPTPVGGKNLVSPFFAPGLAGGTTYPIYQIPSRDNPILSIAALQHVPLSMFQWHPGYAIGNSLADPQIPRDKSMNHVGESYWVMEGGDTGNQGSEWKMVRQGIDAPQNWLYDLSYEANHELWDKYFLSSIDSSTSFSASIPLRNPRVTYLHDPSSTQVRTKLRSANDAASELMLAGAFNVNSTSVEAWKALLMSFQTSPEIQMRLNSGSNISAGAVFSRLLSPVGGEYRSEDASDPLMWNGYRKLDDNQINNVAREIVVEVKRRGPFLSLSDFINRRLVKPPGSPGAETDHTKTGLKGTLQAAIDRSNINEDVVGDSNNPPTPANSSSVGANVAQAPYYQIPKAEYDNLETQASAKQKWPSSQYPNPVYPTPNGMSMYRGMKPDHFHYADSKLTGAPACIMQADVLQKIGPALAARGDTFVIRAYGEAKEGTTVKARAWIEATVQRTPEPIDGAALDPVETSAPGIFGRKFAIVSFRWLNSEEI